MLPLNWTGGKFLHLKGAIEGSPLKSIVPDPPLPHSRVSPADSVGTESWGFRAEGGG